MSENALSSDGLSQGYRGPLAIPTVIDPRRHTHAPLDPAALTLDRVAALGYLRVVMGDALVDGATMACCAVSPLPTSPECGRGREGRSAARHAGLPRR